MDGKKIEVIMELVGDYGSMRLAADKADDGMSCKGYSAAAQAMMRKAEDVLDSIRGELEDA